jgi:hypothetical protein
MVMLRNRDKTDRTVQPAGWSYARISGWLGALAAIIGVWLFHAPAGGTLTFLAWDFDVATMSDVWPFGLIIVGGLAAAVGFGTMAQKMFFRDDEVTLETFAAGAMAFLGAVAVVAYALIWIF